MMDTLKAKRKAGILAGAFLLAAATASLALAGPPNDGGREDHGDGKDHPFRHVLLISIDGMHALDFINCSQGIAGVNGGAPYCPTLAALSKNGVSFLEASTSRPSDSFPGLTAIVSGGSPRTFGAYYDVGYDRSLDPPAKTTGNGTAGAPGLCTPGAAPTGTTAEYEEGIDLDQTQLNGGAPGGADGGIASIDPTRLPRDPAHGCAPVYPWNFVRTNTIFGVIHAAGGYTAWSDKHPAYTSVNGPGNGTNVDDFYGPEINSVPVGLPGVAGCNPLPDQTAVAASNAWTDSFQNIQCYDTLKVNAVLNEINGKTHNGKSPAPRPNILGMNFQTVSVGQKLIEKQLGVTGGYEDSIGTPTPSLLGEIEFTDAAIGKMVAALQSNGILDSTLIVISAKHGQSPVDSSRYLGISTVANDPVSTSPSQLIDSCLPDSESNAGGQIGPTEDDVSLLWLRRTCSAAAEVKVLETQSPATNNVAAIGQIFSGPAITQMFNAPGLPPNGDPRTPDIIVTPNVGVTYSGSSKKLAEHGGFSHDDTNVMMVLSNPFFHPVTVTSPVETAQIAPTILAWLGLDPNALQGVQLEHTQVLPAVQFGSGEDH
jgi:hypothetical protein